MLWDKKHGVNRSVHGPFCIFLTMIPDAKRHTKTRLYSTAHACTAHMLLVDKIHCYLSKNDDLPCPVYYYIDKLSSWCIFILTVNDQSFHLLTLGCSCSSSCNNIIHPQTDGCLCPLINLSLSHLKVIQSLSQGTKFYKIRFSHKIQKIKRAEYEAREQKIRGSPCSRSVPFGWNTKLPD